MSSTEEHSNSQLARLAVSPVSPGPQPSWAPTPTQALGRKAQDAEEGRGWRKRQGAPEGQGDVGARR